jgi:transcriptional regulator of acetoin/glycerol metabolism
MSVLQESVGVPCESWQTIADLRPLVHDGSPGSTFGFEIPPGLRLADLVKAAVLQTLDRLDGNRTQAALCLGISVRTLQRKLKQWNGEHHASGEEADPFEAAMR